MQQAVNFLYNTSQALPRQHPPAHRRISRSVLFFCFFLYFLSEFRFVFSSSVCLLLDPLGSRRERARAVADDSLSLS